MRTSKEEYKSFVDNLEYEGDTLAKRRLKMFSEGIDLYPIKVAIFSFGELLKIATPTQWFIDSKGQVFVYKKTRYVPLVYKEITKYQQFSAFEVLITVQDSVVYKSLYPPEENEKYAIFLQISPKALILYGFSKIKYENKRKKI